MLNTGFIQTKGTLIITIEVPFDLSNFVNHRGFLVQRSKVALADSLVTFRFSFREAPLTGLILRNDRDNLTTDRIVRKFLDNPNGTYRKSFSILHGDNNNHLFEPAILAQEAISELEVALGELRGVLKY